MKIQICVCSHKPVLAADISFLTPIQAGAALSEHRFQGFLPDDTGENISGKNLSYCELTAQYWAWRNLRADYIGLFHYRRYLYPDGADVHPYRMERAPDEATLRRLDFMRLPDIIASCDLIVPRGERQPISVRRQYAAAPSHQKSDLVLVERILRERYPEYAQAVNDYFSGRVHFFCNLFIMNRTVFEDYCAWLFAVLEEFDRCANPDGCTRPRVDGYLGERLLGVYYTRWAGKLRTKELPWVQFEPNPAKLAGKKLELLALPVESRRRATVKRLLGML